MSDNFNVDDDAVLQVKWGDPRLMGFCSICNVSPCNAVNERFGVCPICHKTDGYLNNGNDHAFFCKMHRACWWVGANLFSSAMGETREQQRAEQERIGFASYEKFAPHYDTTGAGEESDGCHCFRCEDNDVREVQFGDPKLMYGPEDYCKVCLAAPCNADKHYFGVCPTCHQTDGYVNAGKTHIFICRKHRTRWIVGSNLMSSWRDETEAQQRALYDKVGVGEFDEVVPYCSDVWIGPSASGTMFAVHKFSLSPVDDPERQSDDWDKQRRDSH